MLHKLKYLIIGSPLPSQMMAEKQLNKIRALAAFSPDALSSLAYANQEIFLALAVAGSAGLSLQFPIALSITLLLAIVALSYTQVVRGYPGGGGSYIVVRENLGLYPSLVTAGALAVGLHTNGCSQPDCWCSCNLISIPTTMGSSCLDRTRFADNYHLIEHARSPRIRHCHGNTCLHLPVRLHCYVNLWPGAGFFAGNSDPTG